jgi:FHA domain
MPDTLLFIDGAKKSQAPDSEPQVGRTGADLTEIYDSVAFLDERVRHGGRPVERTDSGRYMEIQGPLQTLRIPLDEEIIHIGRGIGSDLHLDDSSVSRRHALLVPRPGGQRILDDRSANGTFVNGRRVDQVDLHNGDVVTVGRAALRYVDVSGAEDD